LLWFGFEVPLQKAHGLEAWSPARGTILGCSGNFRSKKVAVGSSLGVSYPWPLLPPCMWLSSLYTCSPCHEVLPCHEPRINRVKDYGLKSLKPRAKINPSLSCLCEVFCHSNKKLTSTWIRDQNAKAKMEKL
jgi:hypothetical protein